MKNIRVIYIFGPDGSGKSTIAKVITERINSNNQKAVYRWMRFNHITSKLVNGLGRITGLSQKIRYDNNVVVGYHYYEKSSFISWLYIVTTLFDLLLVYPFKILIPLFFQNIIVVDRFTYDILIDLMVDTGMYDLHKKWPGKLLQKVLPPENLSFFLDVDINVIYARRPDTLYDKTHPERHKLYKKLSDELSLNSVTNNGSIEFAVNTILSKVSI